MKKLGFMVGASLAALSVGCAFLGFSGIPTGTGSPAAASTAPSATPSPTPTAKPTATPATGATLAPGDATKGQSLYSSKCLSCHLADGKGLGFNVTKKDFDTLKAKKDGTMSSQMAGMTDQDIVDLEVYLKTL